MTIGAKDLRIGNYLTTYVGKVIGQKEAVKIELSHIKHIQDGNEFNYEGIPLTPEWLEKAGFKSTDSEEFSLNGISILKREDDNGEIAYGLECESRVTGKLFKHLHQLQNLYYALTGQELEFAL